MSVFLVKKNQNKSKPKLRNIEYLVKEMKSFKYK